MKNRISILTLSVLCAIAVFGENDANAQQRGRKRSRVLAVRGLTKVQNASDYANSDGANQNVPVRVATADDCGAGTYFDAASSSCLVCASGTWSTAKSSGCTSCGDNVIACDATNGNPIACATGYKLDGSTCVADTTTTPPPVIEDVAAIKDLKQKFALQLTDVSAKCSGIYDGIDELVTLNATSTIAVGTAGLASGAAIAEDIIQEKVEAKDTTKKLTQGITSGAGALAAGTATAASGVSIVKANALKSKMEDCNEEVQQLKLIKGALEAEIADADKDPASDKTVARANSIIEKCEGKFNENKMKEVWGTSIASTVATGVGTLGAGFASVVSFTGKGSEKGWRAGKNIASGVAAGLDSGAAIASGVNWNKLDGMRGDIKECENVLKDPLVEVTTTEKPVKTTTSTVTVSYGDGDRGTTTTSVTTEGGESVTDEKTEGGESVTDEKTEGGESATDDTTEGGESTTDTSDGE